MSDIEAQRVKVKSLLDARNFEIWSRPAQSQAASPPHPGGFLTWWSMRIGDPRTSCDQFIDPCPTEEDLWDAAEDGVAALVQKVAELDAKRLMRKSVNQGCKANEPIKNAMIQSWAVEEGIDGMAQIEALQFAGSRAWIEDGPRAGTTSLTVAGWQAGRS